MAERSFLLGGSSEPKASQLQMTGMTEEIMKPQAA